MSIYPDYLKTQIRNAKMPVFAQAFTAATLGDCENCGGLGNVYVFFTERGPFRDVPGVQRSVDSVLKSVEDEMYGWVWYVGKLAGAPCPVCKGIGKQPRQAAERSSATTRQFNTGQPIKRLAEQFQR